MLTIYQSRYEECENRKGSTMYNVNVYMHFFHRTLQLIIYLLFNQEQCESISDKRQN